jgi:diguanylate cyclase (GGDEF)-like protein
MTMRRRSPTTGTDTSALLLREVPPALRRYVIAVYVAAAGGFVAAAALIGSDAIATTFGRPVLWMVVGLVAIADLYPLTPWMRDVRGRIRIHWSGAFTLAVVLVGGPPTVLLFPLIALAAVSSLPSRFWRLGFNVAVLTLEGLVGVLALHLIFGPWPASAGPLELLAAGNLLALLWEAVNVGGVCTAMVLLDGTPWRQCLRIGWRRTAPWLAALVTSPMIAYVALTAPELIPGLALVTVVVHTWIATLIRKTDEARTDQLTGLANRTAALEQLEADLSLHRLADSVTLVMIDLDGFKAVNDTYGHDVGDRVLADVGGRIRAALPAGLLVARLGGDEFVVVGQDLADPAAIAATIRAAIREPLFVSDGTVRLDCSTGWVRARSGDDPMDVLRAADHNLYRAKSLRHSADGTGRPVPGEATTEGISDHGFGAPHARPGADRHRPTAPTRAPWDDAPIR